MLVEVTNNGCFRYGETLFKILLVISGCISFILTLIDPVFSLTYSFPNSHIDTITHVWDCLSFGGVGISFGILTFLFGIWVYKRERVSYLRDGYSYIEDVFMLVFSILFGIIGYALYARQNHVSDPDLSNDVAITSEGFELFYHMRCGEYMFLHHPIGLVGAFFWTWCPLCAFFLFCICYSVCYSVYFYVRFLKNILR